jgi:SprB repeat
MHNIPNMKYIIIVIILFSGIATPAVLAQSRHYVHATATGGNSGLSWADAFTDLQTALGAAQPGDQVWVAEGTYLPTNSSDRAASFELSSGVALYGGFAGTETELSMRDWAAHPTVLSGDIGASGDSTDNSYTVLYLFQPDSSTVLDGFTVCHGVADGDAVAAGSFDRAVSGGGLYIDAGNWDAFPNIRNCWFWHNTALEYGAGVLVYGTSAARVTPRFEYCSFEANHSLNIGGGLARFGGSWVERGIDFQGCDFIGNRAALTGGGLYYSDSQGANAIGLDGCTFVHNVAGLNGGGAYFLTGKSGKSGFGLRKSKFLGNMAGEGSAIVLFTNGSLFDGDGVIDSCTFSKNISVFNNSNGISTIYADQWGNFGSKVILNNTLFEENISPSRIISLGWLDSKAELKNITIKNNNSSILVGLTSFSSCEISHTLFSSNRCNASIALHSFSKVNAECKYINCLFEKNENVNSTLRLVGAMGPVVSATNSSFLYEKRPASSYKFIQSAILFSLNFTNNLVTDSLNKFFFNIGDVYLSHNSFGYFDCADQFPNVTCGPGILSGLDPMFRDTANGDYSLLPCSPLINAGSNAAAAGILTDITGAPRIQESTVDIGAYESPAFALAAAPAILPACTGAPGGAITISPANGCEPYTYQWMPAAGNGPEITGLPPGSYSYTVTDARGRMLSDTLSIVTAPSPQISPLTQNIQCGSPLGGSATVSVSNGTAPYSFLWENAAIDSLRTMLPVGEYQVTVTDQNGCRDSVQMNITKQGNITLMVDGQPISCFGQIDASISAAPVNGKAPYQYLWSPTGSSDSLLTGLGPGMYTVTATDFYGCTASFTFNLSDPPLLQATVLTMPCSSLQSPNGIATANPNGGIPSYTYAWSNLGSTMSIGGLPPGTYTVTITDAHGCSATATAEVKLLSNTAELEDINVQVWPNPMREQLELRAAGLPGGEYRFALQDALGREVDSTAVQGERAVLDVRDLAPGVYSWSLEGWNGRLASGIALK